MKCAHIICDYGMRCCIYISSSLNYRFDQGPMTSPPHLKKKVEQREEVVLFVPTLPFFLPVPSSAISSNPVPVCT